MMKVMRVSCVVCFFSLVVSLSAEDVILYEGKLYTPSELKEFKKKPKVVVTCGASETWGEFKKKVKGIILMNVSPQKIVVQTKQGSRIPLIYDTQHDGFNVTEVLDRVRKVGSDAHYIELNELRDFDVHAPEKRGIKHIVVSADDSLPAHKVVGLLAKLHIAKIKYTHVDTKIKFRRGSKPESDSGD